MNITPPDDPYYRSALAVARRLLAAGYETYFAGGAVRDAILGNGAQDWDIATAATPDEVEGLFGTTFPVGKEFGVVIVLEGGFPFEVATFRSDGAYVDGRRPQGVVFTTPRQDVERRDFTINGLLLAPETGEVVDYVGGITDLRHGVIRAIGNPRARFTEDKLRMLRAVRFAARFALTWDPETEQALSEMACQINVVSRERIRNELQKMLTGPAPARALRDLWRLGLLQVLLPEVTALEGVEQNPLYHPEGDVLTHTIHLFDAAEVPLNPALAWAALLHDVGKKPTAVMRKGHNTFYEHEKVGADMAATILEELKASRALIHDVASLVRNHMKFSNVENMRVAKFKRLMAQELSGEYEDGHTWFDLLTRLHKMDVLGSNGDLGNVEIVEARARAIPLEEAKPAPLVTGKDLIARGLRPGPQFGPLLEELFDAQLEGLFSDREGALRYLDRVMEGSAHVPSRD